jgi:2-amino-4-hydroxy-6-hydroxymethyldihydropteridine diphosphokinase
VFVAVALGSNLGDRRDHLDWAVLQLRALLPDLRVSEYVETDPVDVPDEQPRYLNAVAVGSTSLGPEALLAHILELERQRGRVRAGYREARTLDLDLILYDELTLNTVALTLPHPRFRDRLFVVGPLASLAPDARDPVTGLTMGRLLERLVTGR